jgi:beta-glucanase (GH16 family)
MRSILRLLLVAVMTMGATSLARAQSPSGWTLAWSDEFNGSALDTSKWTAVTNCGDRRNNEQQCYTADDVSVANGRLTIRSEHRSLSGFAYTSGAVKTSNKFTQAYGRFEFSARLPAGGQGVWPALWLYPPNQWPPEIDVLEAINDMRTIYMTYHWGTSSNHMLDSGSTWVSNPSTAFHLYAMEWAPGVVRWYIDGVLVKTHTGSDVTNIPMQLYINTALGGDWPGSVAASTVFPQTLDVDYVRVYVASSGSGSGDTTNPTVSLTSPTGGATLGGTVTLSASASDNVGVAGVWFTLDGTTIGSTDTSAPYSLAWNTTGSSNGSHVLRAVARDAAGNTAMSSPVTVTINNSTADTTPPSVSVTAPSNSATVSGAVTVRASASDNVGVASVQFTLDGVALASPDTTAPYQVAWSTGTVANGTHTLRAIARDAAGNSRTSAAITVTVSNAGSSVAGDLNGDGLPDLTFQNAAGQIYTWFMNNGSLMSGASLGTVDASWQVAAIDDFNGDGKSDILWQRAHTGELYLWLMDGPVFVQGVAMPAVDPSWHVAASGDLNGDGSTDLVWQQDGTGALFAWLLHGTAVASTGALTPAKVAPSWQVVGLADLNQDHHPDLVWQNTSTGALYVWFMNGLVMQQSAAISAGSVPPQWHVRAVADFNHDGRPDLVFQNTLTGQLYAFYLNGTTLASEGFLTPNQVSLVWQIVGGR